MSRPAHWMAAGWPRRVRDWKGLRVRVRRSMSSRLAGVPEGTLGTLWNVTRSSAIGLTFDACEHCGVEVHMTRIKWQDLEIVE